MAQRKKQPGVMLYFDVRPCLKRLTFEEKGRLFEAILNYAELGIIPDVEGALGVAWDFMQPRIDVDKVAYAEKCAKARDSVNERWATKREKRSDEYDRIQSYSSEF